MQILVDADALPGAIRELLFRAAIRREVVALLVAGKRLRVPASPWLQTLQVTTGPDEADDRITELAQPGDLVITADIPLADRVIARGAVAISPRGERFDPDNIKQRLSMRDLLAQLRDTGEIGGGGPAAMTTKDVQAFANLLDRTLAQLCRKR
jgi:uncharacterized protein